MNDNAIRHLLALADTLEWLGPDGPVRLNATADRTGSSSVLALSPFEARNLSEFITTVVGGYTGRLCSMLANRLTTLASTDCSLPPSVFADLLRVQRRDIAAALDEHPDLLVIVAEDDGMFADLLGDRAKDTLDTDQRVLAMSKVIEGDVDALETLVPNWRRAAEDKVRVIIPEDFDANSLPLRHMGESDEEYARSCEIWRTLGQIGGRQRRGDTQ